MKPTLLQKQIADGEITNVRPEVLRLHEGVKMAIDIAKLEDDLLRVCDVAQRTYITPGNVETAGHVMMGIGLVREHFVLLARQGRAYRDEKAQA